MYTLELTAEEAILLRNLLKEEEGATHTGIHHAHRSFEYRETLKRRVEEIHSLIAKIDALNPLAMPKAA